MTNRETPTLARVATHIHNGGWGRTIILTAAAAILIAAAAIALTPDDPDPVDYAVYDAESPPDTTITLSGAGINEGTSSVVTVTIDTSQAVPNSNVLDVTVTRTGGPPLTVTHNDTTVIDADTTSGTFTIPLPADATSAQTTVTVTAGTDSIHTGDGTLTFTGEWQ